MTRGLRTVCTTRVIGSALGGDRLDNTAFDTMLVVRSGGEQHMLGVETKCTEPFTQERYDKPGYRAVTDREGSWFKPGAAEIAKEPKTNQLWRNMLAQETATLLECAASVVVLTAAHDHDAEQAVEDMKPLLVDPDGSLTHALFEDVITAAEDEPTLAAWARRFRERYTDLGLAGPPT